jgi:hypothetical protein
MSDRSLKAAGAASRGADDASMDARGRSVHGAIAEGGTRAARIRRNAWLLGGLAVFFYVGYMVWIFIRAGGV